MNVSTSSSSHAPFDSKPIRDLFDSVRSEHSNLNQFLDQTFDELETLRASLGEYQHDLENQHAEVKRVREELDGVSRNEGEQLEAIKTELDTTRADLEQLRLRNVEELTADDEAARHEIEELCAERDSLRSEVESVRGRIAELEQTAEEPDEVRAALDEAQDQQNHSEAALQDVRTELDQAQQEITLHRDQNVEFKHERTVLEKELESVRGRACELTDAMDQTQREMAEERAQWTVELDKMRQLLERQMELSTSLRPTAVGPTAIGAIADVSADAVGTIAALPEAAVVGTVMAQFDNIRRQRALRREKKQKDSA